MVNNKELRKAIEGIDNLFSSLLDNEAIDKAVNESNKFKEVVEELMKPMDKAKSWAHSQANLYVDTMDADELYKALKMFRENSFDLNLAIKNLKAKRLVY